MSITPAFADNSASTLERRLHARQQVTALAYLDIGSDNGGIVLNLSEDGMALQAVAPLHSQADVALRIQLPHSHSRIETAAKIVWLSQSNRQAGVRFAEMSSEARVQIQEWIRSQTIPVASSSDNTTSSLTVEKTQPKEEKIPEYQRDKWLSLMAELEVPGPGVDNQSPVPPTARTSHGDVAVPGAPSRIYAPEVVLNPFGPRGKSGLGPGLGSRSAEEQVDSSQEADVESGAGVHAIPPDATYAATTSAQRDTVGSPVLDWPNRVAAIVPAGSEPVAAELASAVATPVPSGTATDLAVNSHAVTHPRPASPLPGSRSNALKWIGVAAAFVLFSVLCFSIGAWIGSLRNSGPSVSAVAARATLPLAASNAESASTAERRRSGNEAKPEAKKEAKPEKVEKSRPPAPRSMAPRNPKPEVAPSINSRIILPVHQQAAFAQVKPAFATMTATKPPQNNPPPSPAPDNSNGANSAPRMVDGRVLRPSDRFNPCHLTYRVEPAYPLEAQQQHVEGSVKIHLSIGADGSVQSARLIGGPAPLTSAAMDAAKYWRYMPALLNGEPVATEQDVEIDFRLPH